MQIEEYALRLNASDFASRSILPAHPQELYLLGKELGLMSNQENNRYPTIQCRRN